MSNIAILSGKGGAGKTLIAVNLAYVSKAHYLDYDIEAPNGYIYFKSSNKTKINVYNKKPKINHLQCSSCKACVDFCKFNALAMILGKVEVFLELCHSCKACEYLCPNNAIEIENKKVGEIIEYYDNGNKISIGKMDIGQVSGVKILEEMNKNLNEKICIIDSPPGASCSVIESIKRADYCLLVLEDNIFGFSNFKMVYKLCKSFNKKIGVVINKSTNKLDFFKYAKNKNIKILGEIPLDFELAKHHSNSEIVSKNKKYFLIFKKIFKNILKEMEEIK